MATSSTVTGSRPEHRGLSYWMERALKELDHVCTSPDADAVHDLRVALRRCRSVAAVMEEVDPDRSWAEMRKLGKKQMTLELRAPLAALPPSLAKFPLTLADGGCKLVYTYDTQSEHTGITDLLDALRGADVRFKDLATSETSLEDIFVSLLRNGA